MPPIVAVMHDSVAWYTPYEPPPTLDGILACSWVARPTGSHRLTPDACTDLLRISDGTFVLCGPERTSWTFRLPDGLTAVGVRFRPAAAHAVFGIDVSSIVDRRVPLAELIGDDAARATSNSIAALDDLDDQRATLVDAVASWRPRAAIDPEAELVLEILAESPHAGQRQLADAAAMSVRSLRRLSLRQFGYGTATLARILRFQRFLAVASMTPRPESLAMFAALAGYVDHAHLARDCRAITSLSPTAFLAEYFPTFPNMADPYKTAGASWATLAS